MEPRKLILLLDSEPDMMDALEKALSECFIVHKERNVSDALEYLREEKVDLIISDQPVPGRNFIYLQKKHILFSEDSILSSRLPDIQVFAESMLKKSVFDDISDTEDDALLAKIVAIVLSARLAQVIKRQKDIEQHIEEIENLAILGERLAGIAHEINNPLGFISSNLANLSRFMGKLFHLLYSYDQTDMSDDFRDVIEREKDLINFEHLMNRIPQMIERSINGADRMAEIIKELKLFSRKDDQHFQYSDLHEAIDTTLTIFDSGVKPGITIIKDFGSIPLLECRIGKLQQVLLNILSNAADAISGLGTIWIKTSEKNDSVLIEITDTGSGIIESVAEHIFDSFFTTKARGKGTGLGLSISKKIIENHNGQIWFRSKLGKGTTFFIQLPVKQPT